MNIEDMRANANDAAEFLKSMAHPERLMVLCQLTQGEVGFTELCESSSLSQSAFSQHLTVLKRHGLVKVRKESQLVYYSLADSRVELLMSSLHNVFCQQQKEEI
ncbi:ArsR/SmtB family transcription factor [Vibrio hibernica]|uniref:ArsR/SmtB family transcription factor n=1 Tax=Vibrio hibernica TaxID=2587465 RepID=UPI00188047DD|nr:metalloregulator ArsR/SmtB family transcription factor [Vibrio hibernica]